MTYLIFCSFEVGGLPFQMAEILNRHGRETLYASLSSQKINDPNSRRFHYSGSPAWDISSRFQRISRSPQSIVRELIRIRKEYGVDCVFAAGSSAHLLHDAGLPYLYWSYGSDLDQICFGPVWPTGYPYWKRCLIYSWHALTVRRHMRRSLRQAKAVLIAPYQLTTLQRIVPGIPMFWLPQIALNLPYEELMIRKSAAREKIAHRIGRGRFLFSSTRHVWQGYLSRQSDNKGNDIMFRAFQAYLQSSGDTETRFVVVRKGPDVMASEDLAQRLGISERVVWVDEMNRADLFEFYQGATICFGQFGTPVFTYAALEALANSTPCITSFQPAGEVPFYSALPPAMNTRNPEEIAGLLNKLLNDSAQCEALGRESWRWIEENCSEQRFVEVFENLWGPTRKSEGEPAP